MNEGELGWLSEGILTVENILPQQIKIGKWNIVSYSNITRIYGYKKNSQSVLCSAIVSVGGIVDIYIQIIRYDV